MTEANSDDRSKTGALHPNRRRLLRGLAIAAIVVALYALTGFFLVPRIIRWAVQEKGTAALHREVTLGKVAFNPFTLEADLLNLRIRNGDRQPLLSFRRLHVNLQISGIGRRAWRLREVTIDEPLVAVRILRDGSLSIDDLLKSEDKSSALPRLIVDHLAIHSGRFDFVDESVTPRFAVSFAPVNVDANDLVTLPGEQGEYALQIGFDRGSTIRIAGKQVMQPFGLSGRIEVKNIALTTFAERLAAGAPLAIHRGRVDIGVSYELRRGDSGGIQVDVNHGELTATDLALSPRGESVERVTIPRLEVRDVRLAYPARRVEVGLVRLIEPRGAIGWNTKGQFNWPGGAGPAEAAGRAQSPPSPASEQWKVKVAKAAIERGALHVEDQSMVPPAIADLSQLAVEATGISNDIRAPIGLSASANANGNGRFSLRGTLTPSPFSLDSQSSLSAIDLVPFRGYAASVHGLILAAGTLGFDGRMFFSAQQPHLIEGNGTLTGIELQDLQGRRLLGCESASLRNLRLDGATSRTRIRRIDLDGMYANVAIDKQRNLNLSGIGSDAAPAAEPVDSTSVAKPAEGKTTGAKPTAARPAEPAKGSFDVGVIDIRNATIDYRDDSLVLPFATLISSVSGKITDFSTTSNAASTIRLEGNVAEHGSMKAEGTLRASDPFAGTDLTVRFRSVPMPKLTPYSVEFAGYEIDRGLLDLDIHYRIVDRRLTGNNGVVATDLTLGKKVGGSRAGFAVRLAIALLKDRQGRIDMQVPIEGKVDSPQFDYRAVLWQAVKTILGSVAKAPFRALGRAMGIGGENLEVVSFDPGEATVLRPDAEKLTKMAVELAARPELILGVEGRFDRKLDGAAIRKAKLESAIASRRESPKAASGEPPSLESILEALYSQTFSPDRLTQERAKFTPPAAPSPAEPKKSWRRPKSQPSPLPAEASFDANGFYDELRAQLVAAQNVSADELQTLARDRAAAVLAVFASKGLAETRLKALAPAETTSKPGTQQVGSKLKLSAQRPGSTELPDD